MFGLPALRLSRLFRPETVQPVPPDKDTVDSLVDSVNDSAKQASTIALTFLATVIYVAITAASTTDEQLLLNSPLTLPLFNVGVSIRYFYLIAPFLVVFLHLNLLLQEYFIAYRVYRLPKPVLDNEADRFFLLPSVTMRLGGTHLPLMRVLLRLVFMAITVALPIAVLILLQLMYLPYHDSFATHLHQFMVLFDIGLVSLFFSVRPKPLQGGSARRPEIILFFVLAICIIVYSNKLAVIPESCEPSILDKMTGHRSLHLTERVLVTQEPPSQLVAAHEGDHAALDVLWRMHSLGIRLIGRDLRCADFTGSKLINADFRSSDLRGANFRNANLQGADFSPLGTTDHRLHEFTLSEAGVTGTLSEETQTSTHLEDVIFTLANLREANFHAAQLARSHLENADLRAADLSFASLDGAKLVGARLFAANLNSTSLRGTNFQGAQLQGANLSSAKAEHAVFIGADLQGAKLARVKAIGAEFSRASLQGATGLPLQGLDLRQAKMAHAFFCDTQAPQRYLDMRNVDLLEQKSSDLEVLEKGLSSLSSAPTEAKKLLLNSGQAKACIPIPSASDPILYSRQQPNGALERWPASQKDEDDYYEQFASYLMEEACAGEESLRLALEQRVLDRLTVDPGDSLARKLARRLRREILSPTCNLPFNFHNHEDVKKRILSRGEQ